MFEFSPRAQQLIEDVSGFMERHVIPNEAAYHAQQAQLADRWQPVPVVEELKRRAREEGMWNLFLPDSAGGAGLSNLDYAPLAELMGRVHWASEVFNCSAPDTGNMEILERFGTPEQKERWLNPLLEGRIRSAFCMTEVDVASSDATNVRCTIERRGESYVINGRKWWSSGAGDPRCELLIVMGKTDPDAEKYAQQSMILVPRDTAGVTVVRMLPVFGYDDAPHGHAEVVFEDAVVPAENVLLGEGRGFEIAQARLGPGRVHHCMRAIGLAERALELTCRRLLSRSAFGRRLSEHGVLADRVAEARILISQSRLLVLNAAARLDAVGNKMARREIAEIKVAVPAMACKVVDWAIQAHGAAGVTDDFGLSYMYKIARTLRIVDGPDEVHRQQIARLELRKYAERKPHA